MNREAAKELCLLRQMLQELIQRVDNFANQRIDAANEELNDTQIGLTEAYENTLNNADAITNTELALTEIYEMMLEGGM